MTDNRCGATITVKTTQPDIEVRNADIAAHAAMVIVSVLNQGAAPESIHLRIAEPCSGELLIGCLGLKP